jgi:aspartate beta-hydroxylase
MHVSVDSDRRVGELIGAARLADLNGQRGDWDRLLRQAEALMPRHPLVISEAALRPMYANDPARAAKILEQIAATYPSCPSAWFNLGRARRALNQTEAAIEAFERVLAIDPRDLAAMLMKASVQEQRGENRAAAVTYFAALGLIPPHTSVVPGLQAMVERAKASVEANNRSLEQFLDSKLGSVRARFNDPDTLKRFDASVDILLRKRRICRQQPTFFFFPGLPTVEFYDRKLFPWLATLEKATDDIRSDLLMVLETRGVGSLPAYLPTDKAGTSRRPMWRSYPFWREGTPFPAHMELCPKTMAAIRACPIWDSPGLGPNAMFSILEGGAKIAPHTGPINTRLVLHLPLIVPGCCGFRVGSETREWKPGEAFVFDDTIEHEAWNHGPELRVVLIVDIWSPFLSAAERELVSLLSGSVSQYYAEAGRSPVSTQNFG